MTYSRMLFVLALIFVGLHRNFCGTDPFGSLQPSQEKYFVVLEVKNIPTNATTEDIKNFFSTIAPIAHVSLESNSFSFCLGYLAFFSYRYLFPFRRV